MTTGKSVLLIGLQPKLVDFSLPEFAASPGLDAHKIQEALDADEATLKNLGYDVEMCLTDLGSTAEDVVVAHLQRKNFDCIVIGAGLRTISKHFILFEKLLNVVHEHAPTARICFNTKPSDTAEAVQRWI
jgi:nucleotide-binding universal stress UspA family protein